MQTHWIFHAENPGEDILWAIILVHDGVQEQDHTRSEILVHRKHTVYPFFLQQSRVESDNLFCKSQLCAFGFRQCICNCVTGVFPPFCDVGRAPDCWNLILAGASSHLHQSVLLCLEQSDHSIALIEFEQDEKNEPFVRIAFFLSPDNDYFCCKFVNSGRC